MKLYYAEVLMPRKVCALPRHVGADVEYVHLDLSKGEQKSLDYLALNPNGKVPTLVDGDKTLWESNAIMCRLSASAGADLWPEDVDRQIEIIRWLHWDVDNFTRYGGALYFEFVFKRMFDIGEPDNVAVGEALEEFRSHAAVLNDHLNGRTFLVGDRLSVADFALAVTLPYAERARLPVDEFPAIKAWHERLNELPAWRDPFPVKARAA